MTKEEKAALRLEFVRYSNHSRVIYRHCSKVIIQLLDELEQTESALEKALKDGKIFDLNIAEMVDSYRKLSDAPEGHVPSKEEKDNALQAIVLDLTRMGICPDRYDLKSHPLCPPKGCRGSTLCIRCWCTALDIEHKDWS